MRSAGTCSGPTASSATSAAHRSLQRLRAHRADHRSRLPVRRSHRHPHLPWRTGPLPPCSHRRATANRCRSVRRRTDSPSRRSSSGSSGSLASVRFSRSSSGSSGGSRFAKAEDVRAAGEWPSPASSSASSVLSASSSGSFSLSPSQPASTTVWTKIGPELVDVCHEQRHRKQRRPVQHRLDRRHRRSAAHCRRAAGADRREQRDQPGNQRFPAALGVGPGHRFRGRPELAQDVRSPGQRPRILPRGRPEQARSRHHGSEGMLVRRFEMRRGGYPFFMTTSPVP